MAYVVGNTQPNVQSIGVSVGFIVGGRVGLYVGGRDGDSVGTAVVGIGVGSIVGAYVSAVNTTLRTFPSTAPLLSDIYTLHNLVPLVKTFVTGITRKMSPSTLERERTAPGTIRYLNTVYEVVWFACISALGVGITVPLYDNCVLRVLLCATAIILTPVLKSTMLIILAAVAGRVLTLSENTSVK